MRSRLHRLLWRQALQLARHQHKIALRLGRLRVTAWWLRGVQSARLGYVYAIGAVAAFLLFAAGFLLFHLGLFFFLPWSFESRGLLLMILGALYTLLAAAMLFHTARHRTWMRLSGADRLVERALRNPEPRS